MAQDKTAADSVRWEDGTSRLTVPVSHRTLASLAEQVQEGVEASRRRAGNPKRAREAELLTLLGTGKGSIQGARKTGLTNFELDKLLDRYNCPAAGRGNKAQRQEKAKELVEAELRQLRVGLMGEDGAGVEIIPSAIAVVVAPAEMEHAAVVSSSSMAAVVAVPQPPTVEAMSMITVEAEAVDSETAAQLDAEPDSLPLPHPAL
jgi:hypothetical protein